jgi:hypothetical protein
MNPSNPDLPPPEPTAPEVEHSFHRYRSNQIPWFVHLLWVCFWILAVYYVLRFLFPVIQGELSNPP